MGEQFICRYHYFFVAILYNSVDPGCVLEFLSPHYVIAQADIAVLLSILITGIGLALTKKNIEQIRGEIWLEAEEGKGSTFYFTIKK
ncbi:MAG TPA: hypothetical protein VGP55_11790 [Chitinophagaceae bacterium]|nr:hypothetical protein [Chitinophagaceae bacterium]